MQMAQRIYTCKYGCGFTRSRKKVVTEHEQHCTYESIKHLQTEVEQLKITVAKLTKQLNDFQLKPKPANQLYNFNYVNDLDDLIEDKKFMDTFWKSTKDKYNALPVFLQLFFKQCKTFYIAKPNKITVKGIIGCVNRRKYGVDGATTQFTWYGFFDAFVHGVCELIELMYGDWLYDNNNTTDVKKCIKQDLGMHRYYKPLRDNYETDVKFRDACRVHKAHKIEIVAILKQIMMPNNVKVL